jgi:hypothetical protein
VVFNLFLRQELFDLPVAVGTILAVDSSTKGVVQMVRKKVTTSYSHFKSLLKKTSKNSTEKQSGIERSISPTSESTRSIQGRSAIY